MVYARAHLKVSIKDFIDIYISQLETIMESSIKIHGITLHWRAKIEKRTKVCLRRAYTDTHQYEYMEGVYINRSV